MLVERECRRMRALRRPRRQWSSGSAAPRGRGAGRGRRAGRDGPRVRAHPQPGGVRAARARERGRGHHRARARAQRARAVRRAPAPARGVGRGRARSSSPRSRVPCAGCSSCARCPSRCCRSRSAWRSSARRCCGPGRGATAAAPTPGDPRARLALGFATGALSTSAGVNGPPDRAVVRPPRAGARRDPRLARAPPSWASGSSPPSCWRRCWPPPTSRSTGARSPPRSCAWSPATPSDSAPSRGSTPRRYEPLLLAHRGGGGRGERRRRRRSLLPLDRAADRLGLGRLDGPRRRARRRARRAASRRPGAGPPSRRRARRGRRSGPRASMTKHVGRRLARRRRARRPGVSSCR